MGDGCLGELGKLSRQFVSTEPSEIRKLVRFHQPWFAGKVPADIDERDPVLPIGLNDDFLSAEIIDGGFKDEVRLANDTNGLSVARKTQ